MAGKKPRPNIPDHPVSAALPSEGAAKKEAARIAGPGPAPGRPSVGKGGSAGSYDDWTVAELRKRAKELGLSGYAGKKKSALVAMLRDS